MIRRNARLRNEYLYRKSLEGKERVEYERKLKVKNALNEGRQIPSELRKDFAHLNNEAEFDDDATSTLRTHIDDEYAKAGIIDPKVLVTTSHTPSSRLNAFAKEVKLIFPNSVRVNRGATQVKDLVAAAKRNDYTDIVVVHEHRGRPDGMIISHLPFGPTAYFSLSNVVLRHDLPTETLGTMSEAYPHLVFDKFESKLGQRTMNILKHLFPVPKDESQRVITFANRNDTILFRHHVYKKPEHNEVELAEVGPRIDMKLYKIRLGSLEMEEASDEWVLRPYMNTAKKRKLFSV